MIDYSAWLPAIGQSLMSIRKLPLPLRERVGVRGMGMASLDILT